MLQDNKITYVLWLPYAFSVAVFVDVLFGGILRESSTCPPSVSISRIKMFFTAYYSLRLFKLKTLGQTISIENVTSKLQNSNQNSCSFWVIRLSTTQPWVGQLLGLAKSIYYEFVLLDMAGTLVKVQIDPEEIIPSNEPHVKKISPPGTSRGVIEGQPFEQRLDPSPEIQQGGPISPRPEATTGIAFSGGGIRSAAFCSGALRKMLQDNVLLEYKTA